MSLQGYFRFGCGKPVESRAAKDKSKPRISYIDLVLIAILFISVLIFLRG